jgi:hypothetical protein
MKKIYLLMLLLPFALMAQRNQPSMDAITKQILNKQKSALTEAHKESAIYWRVTSTNVENYNSGVWEEYDTTVYEYDTLNYASTVTKSNYNTGTSAYVPATRDLTTYNAQYYPLTITYQSYDGTLFVNSSQYAYVYDGQNRQTSFTYSTWDGALWVGQSRTLTTYDANGMLSSTNQSYNVGISTWENTNRTVYTYNTAGRQESILAQNWVGGVWENNSREVSTYNTEGLLSVSLVQTWISGAWENSYEYTYQYNANGGYSTYLARQWVAGAWENYYRYTYTYNSSDYLEAYVLEYWVAGAWEKDSRQVITYVNGGYYDIYLIQDWDGALWVNDYRYEYTYDSNLNQDVIAYSTWDGAAWVGNSRTFYYYESYEYVGVGITGPLATKEAKVFPNPFEGSITIEFDATAAENATFSLYDITGKQVATNQLQTVAGNNTLVFNTTDLQSGMYFYELSTAGSTLKGKLIKR